MTISIVVAVELGSSRSGLDFPRAKRDEFGAESGIEVVQLSLADQDRIGPIHGSAQTIHKDV